MASLVHWCFVRILLSTAIASSVFAFVTVANATPTTTAGELVSVHDVNEMTPNYVECDDGTAFDTFPLTAQTVQIDLYDGLTFEAEVIAHTTTSTPDWNSGGIGVLATGHQYTLYITDTTDSVSISPNPISIWSAIDAFDYTVYTCGKTSLGLTFNVGTNGISSTAEVWLATSSGGTPFASSSGTLINGGANKEFDFSTSITSATTYYWGFSSTTCTNGVSTST